MQLRRRVGACSKVERSKTKHEKHLPITRNSYFTRFFIQFLFFAFLWKKKAEFPKLLNYARTKIKVESEERKKNVVRLFKSNIAIRRTKNLLLCLWCAKWLSRLCKIVEEENFASGRYFRDVSRETHKHILHTYTHFLRWIIKKKWIKRQQKKQTFLIRNVVIKDLWNFIV